MHRLYDNRTVISPIRKGDLRCSGEPPIFIRAGIGNEIVLSADTKRHSLRKRLRAERYDLRRMIRYDDLDLCLCLQRSYHRPGEHPRQKQDHRDEDNSDPGIRHTEVVR